MNLIYADFFAALIALIHIYIFCLESLLWGKPKTNKTFALSKEMAEANRQFAFNQGFYNLFLAIAILAGLLQEQMRGTGRILVDYGVLSVLGAGFVLWLSSKRLYRPALIQAGPAMVYLLIRSAS